jgi:hypothetical protein
MSVTSEEMKIFADDWQKNALANIASLEFAPSSNTYICRTTNPPSTLPFLNLHIPTARITYSLDAIAMIASQRASITSFCISLRSNRIPVKPLEPLRSFTCTVVNMHSKQQTSRLASLTHNLPPRRQTEEVKGVNTTHGISRLLCGDPHTSPNSINTFNEISQQTQPKSPTKTSTKPAYAIPS